jgi:hydrogenase maturation factor
MVQYSPLLGKKSLGNNPMKLPVGKLPLSVLEKLLKRCTTDDKRIVVGAAIGEDAAVIDTGGPRYLIAKTDPITFTAGHIGWYAVHINANDISSLQKLHAPAWN